MISVREFLYINKHLCDTYHECARCPFYREDISCIFRCKKTEDVPKVVNAIRIAERQIINSDHANETSFKAPGGDLGSMEKILKGIEKELSNMNRILDKRRC